MNNKLVDQFNSSYWSGRDIKVYFGNIFIDESIQLNFTVSEMVKPYYAYSDYVATRVYHGTRIIAGELTVNFKRDSQMPSLLNLIRSNVNGEINFKGASNNNTSTTQTNSVAAVTTNNTISLSQLSNGNMVKSFINAKKNKVYSDPSLYSIPPSIPYNSGLFETTKDGFDVNIILGGDLSSAQTLKLISDSNNYWVDGATIPAPGVQPTTGLKLIGVDLMSVARPMGDDGRNIVETYNFIARNLLVLQSNDVVGSNTAKAVQTIINQNSTTG